MARPLPATWFVAVEALLVHAAVIGVGLGVLWWAPGEDVLDTALRVGGAELALGLYAVIAWRFNPTVDHAPAGVRVGGVLIDDPRTLRDDVQRNKQGLFLLLLPGQLLAGATLDVLAWLSRGDEE